MTPSRQIADDRERIIRLAQQAIQQAASDARQGRKDAEYRAVEYLLSHAEPELPDYAVSSRSARQARRLRMSQLEAEMRQRRRGNVMRWK